MSSSCTDEAVVDRAADRRQLVALRVVCVGRCSVSRDN